MPTVKLKDRALQAGSVQAGSIDQERSEKHRRVLKQQRMQGIPERSFNLDNVLLWVGGLSFAVMVGLLLMLYRFGTVG